MPFLYQTTSVRRHLTLFFGNTHYIVNHQMAMHLPCIVVSGNTMWTAFDASPPDKVEASGLGKVCPMTIKISIHQRETPQDIFLRHDSPIVQIRDIAIPFGIQIMLSSPSIRMVVALDTSPPIPMSLSHQHQQLPYHTRR